MKRSFAVLAVLASSAIVALAGPGPASAPLTREAVDGAGFSPLADKPDERAVPSVVKAEVVLDRARFSPGVIDGIDGENFRKAVTAYQRQNGIEPTGRLDPATWNKLTGDDRQAPLTTYTITPKDAAGPFTRVIPADFQAQSRLPRLGYRNIREALAERFHMSESLLRTLNPRAGFKVGERVTVADVSRPKPGDKAVRVVVDKAGRNVEALAADGRLLAFYPASIGSAEKPALTGEFEIRRVAYRPDYTYLPAFKFKGVAAKRPFTIAPGPNNPVGVVWIELSADGYGIHGTPAPEAVGKTQSHGCIRLTNWDAEDLAARVDKGTPVSFGETAGSTGPVPPAPAAPPAPASSPVAAQPAPPDTPAPAAPASTSHPGATPAGPAPDAAPGDKAAPGGKPAG